MQHTAIVIAVFVLLEVVLSIETPLIDNTCTFHIKSKMFSLLEMNRAGSTPPYYSQSHASIAYLYNFCTPFLPS